ncbi:hypothetical protein DUNSADRAFT_16055 [Dunaliella salina]|uniref:Uncharacterized protein n=1 Tax=Dunaliella salina TaxID=3046 RepID=A0ABQ7G4G3_DUNSA|nr:hypothetical protein DUNSADRAFT_16055 [Dunaliella salina]|eukprot:KAF5829459.1 hypothetical protein DUNSADRAFT_16055 [Dunaliella salina]
MPSQRDSGWSYGTGNCCWTPAPCCWYPAACQACTRSCSSACRGGGGRPDADSDVSDFLVDVGAWLQCAAAVYAPPPGQAAGGGGLLPLTQQCTDEGSDQQALASAPVAAAAAAPAERAVISQREPVLAPSAAAPAPAPVVGELNGEEQPECSFVEKGVVPQHQDTAVLSSWGVRLLRQAVLWGLPCLATLLVEKLLAMRATSSWEQLVILASGAPGTPSTTPPSPKPDFPSACMDQRNQEDVRQGMEKKEETQEVDVNDLGGLLHLGLLSPCPEQMLRAVMGWGLRWGQASSTSSAGNSSSGKQGARAVCGFGWQWDEPNRLGLTPHQLLVSHADKEALLQVLLEMDPAEWLPEQQALNTDPSQQGNLVEICTGMPDGFEQGAGGQGDATRDGSSGPAIGVLRWYNLRQQLESLVSSAMGVLSKHLSGKSHRQGQLHDQTEDGVRAVAADPARPGAARRAPAAMTEAPIPPTVIPSKRTLWKAALRSTLFGLGDGTQWVGGFVGPSEQSFMEWALGYTQYMLAARFNFLLLGCVVGIVRSLTSGLLCQSEVLLQYSITSAYFWGILKRRRKDGMRYARYGHIAMWAFLGLGILPMENNTISMVATYSESLVLFALFSPVLEQSSLRALLLERLSTTLVFFLLFNTLGVRAPLLRAVVQNALSAAAELVLIGAHLRYTFLKAWAESRHRQAMQARKDI